MTHNENAIQRPFAVVTGAESGFGKELARQFASKGFDLIITGSDDRIFTTRDELGSDGVNVDSLVLDLSTFKGVEGLNQAILAFGHPLDVLAFHAELGPEGPFLDTELKSEIQCVRNNILSPIHLLKRIVPEMVNRGHGKILVTSAVGPSTQAPFEAVYGATKSFLFTFTESLRSEIRNEGVVVTTLLPNLYDLPSELEMLIIDDPAELAVECFDAMMSGRDYVFQATLRSKIQSMFGRLLPDKARAFIASTPS